MENKYTLYSPCLLRILALLVLLGVSAIRYLLMHLSLLLPMLICLFMMTMIICMI